MWVQAGVFLFGVARVEVRCYGMPCGATSNCVPRKLLDNICLAEKQRKHQHIATTMFLLRSLQRTLISTRRWKFGAILINWFPFALQNSTLE